MHYGQFVDLINNSRTKQKIRLNGRL